MSEKRNPTAEPHRWVGITAVALVLTAAALLTFWPVLHGEFLAWDDYYNLVENPRFRGFGWENLWWMLHAFHNRIYEPLSWVAKGVQYLLWGMRPAGYHAYSLALHVLNALLVYVLARRLFELGRGTPATSLSQACGEGRSAAGNHGAILGAGLAGLLFAVHPLRTECVALISAQPHVQAGTFCLLSLWAYLHVAYGKEPGKPAAFPGLALLLYALSLLSKATAIGLPVALLVLDIYPLGRWKPGSRRRVVWEKVPFAVLALIALFIAMVARGGSSVGADAQGLGLWGRVAQASFCICFHIYKTLHPVDLAPIYVMLDGFDPWGWRFVGSAVLVVGITLVLVALRRRWPVFWVVWVYYLAMLLPFMGLTDTPHFPVDRYTYLSTLGFAVLAGVGVEACGRARRRGAVGGRLFVPLVSLVAVLSIGLASLSWRQTRVWKNTVVLTEHVLSQVGDYPKRSGVLAMLARALAEAGRNEEAAARYREAVQVNPRNREAHRELGIVLARLGRWEECVAANQDAYRLDPNNWQVNFNLGTALVSVGRLEPGLLHFEQAVRIDPRNYRGYYNLANTLSRVGRYGEALEVLNEGQEQTGGQLSLAGRLAWLLATCPEEQLRDGAKALQLAQAINRETGNRDPRALDGLAAAYAEVGQFDQAARTARHALERCRPQKLDGLCAEIRARLELYVAGRPYRETPVRTPQR